MWLDLGPIWRRDDMTLEFSQNDAIEDPIARLRTTKIVFAGYVAAPKSLALSPAEQEIARVAIHEVGHALTYLVYHRRFGYVSIRPNCQDDSAGRVAAKISNIRMNVAVAGMA